MLFLAFSFVCCFVLFSFFVFLSFFEVGIGEKEKGSPHLDGRAPHVFAGKYSLGTGFRGV